MTQSRGQNTLRSLQSFATCLSSASQQAVYAGLDEESLATAIGTMYPAQMRNRDSQDFIEGPKAFAEKRKPNWRNM
jgi:enoyl-CoA hydratase/carnithine racemase